MTDKDFNLKVSVRNNRILKRVRESYGTPAKMARECGLNYIQLNSLICMRETPFKKNGELKKVAEQVCFALAAMPEELWPDHIASMRVKSSSEVEISAAEAMQIAAGEDKIIQRELLQKWGESLTPREKKAVVERVVNGKTYDELGAELGGVTRERARQIEVKALRKMRAAASRDKVQSYAEVLD